MATTKGARMTYRCSFCGKSQDQVRRLIAGPGGVYICDECVDLCREIIEGEVEEDAAGVTRPTSRRVWSTAMGQKWEYCELGQFGDQVSVEFHGSTLGVKRVQGWGLALQVLGNADWEMVSVVDSSARGSLEARAYFKRPVESGRAIHDTADRL